MTFLIKFYHIGHLSCTVDQWKKMRLIFLYIILLRAMPILKI